MANARLGWFSPLGVAASIRASAGRLAFGLLLPLFGTHRFGVVAGRVGSSAFRFGVALGGLVLPPSGLAFGFTASAFRHAPFRSGPRRAGLRASASEITAQRVGLRAHSFRFSARTAPEIAARRAALRVHRFRFSARAASELPLGELVLPPSASELPFGGLAFGLTASAFRHAPLRGCPRRVGSSARRVGLRAHCFRFSACTASEWPLGEFVLPPSASELPFGGLAFGFTASAFRHAPLRSGLGGLAFGLTASAFRYAPLRGCPRRAGSSTRRVGFSAFRFGNCPRRVGLRAHRFRFSACAASEIAAGRVGASAFRFGDCRWAGWPSGSLLPLFDMHRSAPPHRRRRTDGAQRHDTCFTSKHLSQHVNLPHRTP